MATLAVQKATLAGITPSYAAAAGGGDEFVNDGFAMIHIKNGGGAPINVTVNSQALCDQGTDHDVVVSVTNGQERMIGPFPAARFNDTAGKVQITYSAVTTVTIGIFSR